MIDYAPSAIIEYTDVSPFGAGEGFGGGGGSSDSDTSFYPESILSKYVHFSYDTSTNPSYYAVECPYPDLPSDDLPHFPSPGIGNPWGGSSYTYYWILPLTDSDGNDISNLGFGFALYRTTMIGDVGMYEFVSPGYYTELPPALPSIDGDKTGVFWLYDLGQKVYDSVVGLDNILGFGIGNYNFLYFLLSNGFLVYMTLVIIKFVI